MKIIKAALCTILTTCLTCSAFSWDGVEAESGNDIEIEKGNLVRTGNSIEYYDYTEGEYRSVTIDAIYSYGSTVEIEATDDETGDSVTLEMESN